MKRPYFSSTWMPVLLVLGLAACSSSNQPADTGSASNAPGGSQPAAASKSAPPAIVIPAGTELTVRMESAVGSKTSHDGDPFEASLAEPVVVGEKVVIPKGVAASGVVTQAHAAGKFKGGATLALALRSITVNEHPYPIETSIAAQQTKGKGKRTAGFIGGGAAGGAIIGALAGGGKGAAIGAAVGAGAGTAGAAFTGNRDISLPVETLVRFRLNQDLAVKPK